MTGSAPGGQHVSPNALAAYIDGTLDGPARAAMIHHLADCADCRSELLDARRVLRPARTRQVVGVAAGLAVAASLLVMVLPTDRGGPTAEPLRAGGDTGALLAHGPLGEVSGSPIALAWAPAGPGAAYRVALTTVDGTPVWRASTADTVVTLPDSVTLAPHTTYRWWADALLADGTTRTTGVREFRTSR